MAHQDATKHWLKIADVSPWPFPTGMNPEEFQELIFANTYISNHSDEEGVFGLYSFLKCPC